MTNLIAKVREMCEVGDFVATTAEMDTLLAALGKVQAGDAHILDIIATFFELPKKGMSDASYQKDLEWAGCLRRYADLARLMESSP